MSNYAVAELTRPTVGEPDAQTRLLDSVATFTGQRDLGAMDYSLVLSLAQLPAAQSAALARTGDADELRIIACAAADLMHGGGPANVAAVQAPSWATLRRCIERAATETHTEHGTCTLCVPIRRDGRVIGALQLVTTTAPDAARPLLEGFARIYANYTALLLDSERDKLTGLCNRRTLEGQLQRLLVEHGATLDLAAAGPAGEDTPQVWLGISDIDHFKHVNDTYGHVVGDEIILLLAQQMKASFRHGDMLFRFGGEEFVVLLGGITATHAHAAMERYRRSVEAREYPQVGRVTISIGYACANRMDYPESLIERADKALYYAKEHGRNATCNYDQLKQRGLLDDHVATGSIDLF